MSAESANKRNKHSAEEQNTEKNTEVICISQPLLRGIDQIDRTLAAGSNLTLDFTGCDFISVDGLEWLEELVLRSESLGSTVVFINLIPPVYKIFKVAHIDCLLKACGSPSSVLAVNC